MQGEVAVRTLTEEMRRVARAKLLNPEWIEGMKEHGYKGAAEISKRVGRLYGWQATAQTVDDGVFDDVTRTFLMNEENRRFFEQENPWALEEMARRLLEAAERGLWSPAEDVRDALNALPGDRGVDRGEDGRHTGRLPGRGHRHGDGGRGGRWKKRMGEVLG